MLIPPRVRLYQFPGSNLWITLFREFNAEQALLPEYSMRSPAYGHLRLALLLEKRLEEKVRCRELMRVGGAVFLRNPVNVESATCSACVLVYFNGAVIII